MSPSTASSDEHLEFAWEQLPTPSSTVNSTESLPDRIRRIAADLEDLNQFYNIPFSGRRHERLASFCSNEIQSLRELNFDTLDQQAKIDYLLLRNYLTHASKSLTLQKENHTRLSKFIPFQFAIISLCEDRQDVLPMEAEKVAERLRYTHELIAAARHDIASSLDNSSSSSRTIAFQASKIIKSLRHHLREWFDFYATYDPDFDWWVTTPWQTVDAALTDYHDFILSQIAGPGGGSSDIFGEPIGRTMLLSELAHEMIPYTPEELIAAAHKQYAHYEHQMESLSQKLGYGNDWKQALRHVKSNFVPAGQQTQLVRDLIQEGHAYVRRHDLVTVPPLSAETWRMFMLPPAQQRTAPFFLGGPSILVASPTADMAQDLKMMVLRGNNRHFSRAVAFHEMIPGHRLQRFMEKRHSAHRALLFSTPFFTEGWALYWEMLLWEKGDFFVTPEDKIGTMFWRMHRCMRIVFSLKFHLGQMSPQECVDLLVDKVGHERSTAEGEVRRSLEGSPIEGSYGPLYQAAYLLGALQLWKLRELVVDTGKMGEKEFHDRILRVGGIPVELVKAGLLDEKLTSEFETKWRFL